MRRRCKDPRDTSYRYYGGKGVKVCAAWESYAAFSEWAIGAGYHVIDSPHRGERLSIERIDSNGDYCPENCEWVTGSENSRRMVAAQRRKRVVH